MSTLARAVQQASGASLALITCKLAAKPFGMSSASSWNAPPATCLIVQPVQAANLMLGQHWPTIWLATCVHLWEQIDRVESTRSLLAELIVLLSSSSSSVVEVVEVAFRQRTANSRQWTANRRQVRGFASSAGVRWLQVTAAGLAVTFASR